MADPSNPQTAKRSKEGKSLGGRPRTVTPTEYTPEQLAQIDRWAEAQAKDTTIASALGVDTETFRRQFRERTEQKRAEGKIKLYTKQHEKAGNGDVTMLIWCGKQHLEQSDKQDHKHSGNLVIAPPEIK